MASSLTGGNFWQGAVTGFVVSGLNHWAHKTRFIKNIKDRFKDGLDPNDKFIHTKESVLEFHKKVEGMGKTFILTGLTEDDIVLEPGSSIRCNAEYSPHTNKVYVYNNNRLNWQMAATFFHEYFHAIQMNYLGGKIFLNFYRISNSNPLFNGSPGRDLMEASAYYFQYLMGDESAYSDYENFMKNYYLKRPK